MIDSGGFGLVVALAAGIGLAAASGFRVFVPLLGASLAVRLGWLDPVSGFEWLTAPFVTIGLAVAVLAELGAYFVPWLDNALDTIATPAAVVAGTVLAAFSLGDAPPALQWVLAVVAGGGTAGAVQVGTVALRAGSTVTTGGLGNPLVALVEAIFSGLLTVLAVVVPFVALAAVLGVLAVWMSRRGRRRAAAG